MIARKRVKRRSVQVGDAYQFVGEYNDHGSLWVSISPEQKGSGIGLHHGEVVLVLGRVTDPTTGNYYARLLTAHGVFLHYEPFLNTTLDWELLSPGQAECPSAGP